MNFFEIAQTRYTTKAYNGARIAEPTLDQLKEILRLAPSSINSQPWEFVFVEGQRKDEVFAPLSLINEARVRQASHVVIFRVLDSVERFEEQAPSYVSEGGRAFYSKYIKSQGEGHVQSWMEHQVYVALGYLGSLCRDGSRFHSDGGHPPCRIRQAPTPGRLPHPLCCGYRLS